MTNFRTHQTSDFILPGIFLSLFAFTWVFSLIDAHQTYKALMNAQKVDSVKMRIEVAGDSAWDVTIMNDSVLNQINRSFKYFQEFTPASPKVHSIFIDMDIYKNRKCNLALLKTSYSGWGVETYSTYYRDDSLISVLDHYLRLDTLK